MLQRTNPIAARRGAEGVSERTVRKRFIRNWRARRNGNRFDEVNLCRLIPCFNLCNIFFCKEMEPAGIEPTASTCKAPILPLNYGPGHFCLLQRLTQPALDYRAVTLLTQNYFAL